MAVNWALLQTSTKRKDLILNLSFIKDILRDDKINFELGCKYVNTFGEVSKHLH